MLHFKPLPALETVEQVYNMERGNTQLGCQQSCGCSALEDIGSLLAGAMEHSDCLPFGSSTSRAFMLLSYRSAEAPAEL